MEDTRRGVNQFRLGLEGTQRGAIFRVNVQVPRAQLLHAQQLAAAFVNARRRRHNHIFNRFVERAAILRRVVEAREQFPAEITVVGETGVLRLLLTHIQHAQPQLVERLAVRQLALDHRPPRPFAQVAVVFLQERAHLGQCALFAFPFHRLRAGDFVVFIRQVAFLGKQRNVLFTEDTGFGFNALQRQLKPLWAQARRQQFLFERLLRPLNVRIHLTNEAFEAGFGGFVGGVLRRGNVEARVDFIHALIQRRPTVQPLLHCGFGQRLFLQRLVIRA